MNNKLVTIIFCLLLVTSPFSFAHQGHCEDTELGNNMSQMKKAFKSLKKSLGNEDFKKAEKLVGQLKKLARKAKDYTPLKQKENPDLDLDQYKQQLDKMNRTLDKLLMSIVHKDADQAEALVSQLNKIKKKGHKEFRLECD